MVRMGWSRGIKGEKTGLIGWGVEVCCRCKVTVHFQLKRCDNVTNMKENDTKSSVALRREIHMIYV